MPARFICPHCRVFVDPSLLEKADGAGKPCRICPECDGLIPVWVAPQEASAPVLLLDAVLLQLDSEPCPVLL